MSFYSILGEGYIPTYTRTDFTDVLQDAFEFRTDYQILTMKQMKKYFRIQKVEKVRTFSKSQKVYNALFLQFPLLSLVNKLLMVKVLSLS